MLGVSPHSSCGGLREMTQWLSDTREDEKESEVERTHKGEPWPRVSLLRLAF